MAAAPSLKSVSLDGWGRGKSPSRLGTGLAPGGAVGGSAVGGSGGELGGS
ncbi:hypothetical protein WME76_12175 [Sorangium sp. So ce119]